MLNVQKPSFKQRQLMIRESAIINAANHLLARKGYDLMTMDEVAARVGIAKASLYKHFASKELLAAAAMIGLLDRTLAQLRAQPAGLAPLQRLRDLLEWALQLRMDDGLPALPAIDASLRDTLLANGTYIGKLLDLNEALVRLIDAARDEGDLRADLPTEVVLLTIYARSCDLTADYLKMTGRYTDRQIVAFLVSTCFQGLA